MKKIPPLIHAPSLSVRIMFESMYRQSKLLQPASPFANGKWLCHEILFEEPNPTGSRPSGLIGHYRQRKERGRRTEDRKGSWKTSASKRMCWSGVRAKRERERVSE